MKPIIILLWGPPSLGSGGNGRPRERFLVAVSIYGLTNRKSRRLGVVRVPGLIKVVWHRDLPAGAKLGHAVLSRQAGRWFVCFLTEFDAETAVHTGTAIGVDLGLNNLVATSDGGTVQAPRSARRAVAVLRLRQRALSRCKRGSNRRRKVRARIAAASAKVANQRRDFAHKLSQSLVDRYSLIAFENLNMAGLKRGMLGRSIHDAAWRQIVHFVTYKAKSAGGVAVMVDPRGTVQTCPKCGTIKAKALSERMHRCDCGCTLDRDVAAAKVVLQRATRQGTCLQAPSQRVAA